MSSIVIAVLFGTGAAVWIWTQLARTSGNAHPVQVVSAAAAVGIIVSLVLLTILKGILNLN